jgi:hypothetical protein
MPEWPRFVGLAIIGVAAGSHITQGLLHTVAQQPHAILGGVFATVVVSITAGLLLRLAPNVSASTAMLAPTSRSCSTCGRSSSLSPMRVVIVLVLVAAVGAVVKKRRHNRGHSPS